MNKLVSGLGLVAAILLSAWLVGWSWILISKGTPNNSLSLLPVWPVACTSRDCITSATWKKHYEAMVGFSKLTNQQKPSRDEPLTTLVLQKLVKEELSARLITRDDVSRYREEVLGLNNKDIINDGFGLSVEEYDKLVVMPLLYQEALIEQWGLNTTDELFMKLTKDRKIFMPMRGLKWDSKEMKVK